MEIVWFFALCSLAESVVLVGLEEVRSRSTVRPKDFVELEEKSGDFIEFRETLTDGFLASAVRVNGPNFTESVLRLRNQLDFMHFDFFHVCHAYVVRHLDEYCGLAVQTVLLREKTNNHREWESVRFADDRLYCPLSALHDVQWIADTTFRNVLLFQTIGVGDGHANADVTLRSLQNACPSFAFYARPETTAAAAAAADLVELDATVTAVKQKVADFSNIFCARWKPFMSHRIVTEETVSDRVRFTSPLVGYVLRDVKCTIRKIQEYGYLKYKQGVTVDINAFSPSRSKPNSEPIAGDENEFSLAELRGKLKSNRNYMNLKRYYNVAADVVLLVSVREGRKVFKGIRHTVTHYCKQLNKIRGPARKMRELRTALSAFRSAMDELAFLISSEKRIIVSEHVQREKHDFDQLAVSLVAALDIRDDHEPGQMHSICSHVPGVLLSGYGAYLPFFSLINFYPFTVKFEQFYQTGPLLNVGRLYHFVANDL